MPSEYYPVRQQPAHDSDAESASECTQFIADGEKPVAQPRSRRYVAAVLAITSVVSLLVGAGAGFAASKVSAPTQLDSLCASHTTHYSPVLRDVDVTYRDVVFNGSFLQETIYRQPGSPEVDRAWEALGVDYRAGVIPAEDGPRSGLTPGHVQRADQYGGGYFVNVEGMHHLHCLDLVRKALYYNYPYYKGMGKHAFSNSDKILQLHVSHCIDTLRQVLMCNVDTGVLGQVYYQSTDGGEVAAFPDFHTTHTCKNYDAVRAWAEKLQAPPVDQLPPDYMKPADPKYIRPSTP